MYDQVNNSEHQILNGIDATAYDETIEAVREDQRLALFEFRASNAWQTGGINRSTIKGYYGAGEINGAGDRRFELTADEPPVLFGTDTAPTPVEILLHALAACLTNTIVYKATMRGIEIESITSEFCGDLDVLRFLEIASDGRFGFRSIRGKFRVRANATESQIQELLAFSPVLDMVQNGTPVILSVEKE